MELITDKKLKEIILKEWLEDFRGLKMNDFVKCRRCKRIYKGKHLRVFSFYYFNGIKYVVRCKNPKCPGWIMSIVDKDFDERPYLGIFD